MKNILHLNVHPKFKKEKQKVYLIYTGNDGDSGRLHSICKTRSKCFQVIGEINKDFSFENRGADISRNLMTTIKRRSHRNYKSETVFYNRNIWARIDEVEVIE